MRACQTSAHRPGRHRARISCVSLRLLVSTTAPSVGKAGTGSTRRHCALQTHAHCRRRSRRAIATIPTSANGERRPTRPARRPGCDEAARPVTTHARAGASPLHEALADQARSVRASEMPVADDRRVANSVAASESSRLQAATQSSTRPRSPRQLARYLEYRALHAETALDGRRWRERLTQRRLDRAVGASTGVIGASFFSLSITSESRRAVPSGNPSSNAAATANVLRHHTRQRAVACSAAPRTGGLAAGTC